MTGDFQQEIREIKSKLSDMHNDLKLFLELSKQQKNDSILSGMHSNFSSAIIGHVVKDIECGLENNMVRNCPMRDTCKSVFTGFLQKNASLIKQSNVDESTVSKNQLELQQMKNNAPRKQCMKCFSEVYNLFGKEVDLMRSLRIYNTGEEKEKEMSTIPEGTIVNEVLEPLSSIQRLQILKAVSVEPKTFSAFSELTKLRGGNLLFHLQKLLESGLILQRHERGDYMITDKGYKALKGIGDLCLTLKS